VLLRSFGLECKDQERVAELPDVADEFPALIDRLVPADQGAPAGLGLKQFHAHVLGFFRVLRVLLIPCEPIVMGIAVDPCRSGGALIVAAILKLLRKRALVRGRPRLGDGLHGDPSSWFDLRSFGVWSGCFLAPTSSDPIRLHL